MAKWERGCNVQRKHAQKIRRFWIVPLNNWHELACAGMQRPRFLLFGDSLTERAFSVGGWAGALAHHFYRKSLLGGEKLLSKNMWVGAPAPPSTEDSNSRRRDQQRLWRLQHSMGQASHEVGNVIGGPRKPCQ
eukprot:1157251-Pelagomonas_calceolata.AAC.8